MINQYVNKEDALAFIKSEIKEVSEKWAQTQVSMSAMERIIANREEFSESVIKNHKFVTDMIAGLNDKKKDYKLKTVSDKMREDYKKVYDRQDQDRSFENMKAATKQYEEYLETAQAFKTKLEDAINSKSDGTKRTQSEN